MTNKEHILTRYAIYKDMFNKPEFYYERGEVYCERMFGKQFDKFTPARIKQIAKGLLKKNKQEMIKCLIREYSGAEYLFLAKLIKQGIKDVTLDMIPISAKVVAKVDKLAHPKSSAIMDIIQKSVEKANADMLQVCNNTIEYVNSELLREGIE